MRVLVTGACGFIGSTLVPILLDRGDEVIAFDNLMYGGHPPLIDLAWHPKLTFIHGDVRSSSDLRRALEGRRPEAIVHLAAIVGAPACHANPELATAVNVNGTTFLAHAAAEFAPEAHVVFASTDSCYGQTGRGTGTVRCAEDQVLQPLTEYGRDKEQGERTIRGLCRRFTILRFATAFGLSRRIRLDLLINDFTWQAVHNKHLIVYEAQFGRTFVHVRDIARALLLALDTGDVVLGQTYNVGDDRLNATKGEVAKLVAEVVPGTALDLVGEGRDPDQRDYLVDHSRIKALGFEASVGLKDGIAELVKGYEMIPRLRTPWQNA